MKLLVIGGGGREHAMVWRFAQCPSVTKVWCAPGSDGIAQTAECIALDVRDVKAAADLASKLGADLTIVGPELPLTLGIADEFERRGLVLLGAAQDAAQLEGSKIFAKRFMKRTEFRPLQFTAFATRLWRRARRSNPRSGRWCLRRTDSAPARAC